MPYLLSLIIALTTSIIILLTRYEADDSSITSELDRMKSMFIMIDGFVNTHIQSGGSLTDINFEVLYDNGILPENIRQSDLGAKDKELDSKGSGFDSELSFPNSKIKWRIIPIRDIAAESAEKDFETSAGRAYKIWVDMSNNSSLNSKAVFSESFSGREFCEKMLFGTFQNKRNTYDSTLGKENFQEDGTDKDGIFVCIVFK